MHYHAEIWFGVEPTDIAGAVTAAMAPFEERLGGWWDYWQIGGRWTGAHTPGYDPEQDPANRQTCWLCKGTGKRDDQLGREQRAIDPSYTCNGCQGTGIMTKWPTQWAQHKGDALPVEQVPDDLSCYTLVVCPPDGDPQVFHAEEWDREARTFHPRPLGAGPLKQFHAERGCHGGFLVTVDYHC